MTQVALQMSVIVELFCCIDLYNRCKQRVRIQDCDVVSLLLVGDVKERLLEFRLCFEHKNYKR